MRGRWQICPVSKTIPPPSRSSTSAMAAYKCLSECKHVVHDDVGRNLTYLQDMYVLSVQQAPEQGQALQVYSLKELPCGKDQKYKWTESKQGRPDVSSPEALVPAALSARSAPVLLSDRSRLLALSLGSCILLTAGFYSLRPSLRSDSEPSRLCPATARTLRTIRSWASSYNFESANGHGPIQCITHPPSVAPMERSLTCAQLRTPMPHY